MSAFLIFMMVIGIFSIMTGMTCRNILATNQRPISLPSEGDIPSYHEKNIGSGVSEGDAMLRSSFSSEGDFTQTCHPCSSKLESKGEISTRSLSLYGFTASLADIDTE
jgi:hypothetical protein